MSGELRNALNYVAQDERQRAVEREQQQADDMWAPRRSYNATRIGTDVNAANADETRLRAQGRIAEADDKARQSQALQQRQAMYAPEVDKVENIRGLGDAASWFGTQIGMGAGSMQDPMAAQLAGSAAGTVAGFIPGLRGVAKFLPMLGSVGAFGLNQRQMTGEMYGRLKDDPAAMANLTPQQAYDQSNLYGAGAGALETLLPGAVGHGLGGAALKKGMARTLGRGAPAATALGGIVMEGGTELGQEKLQQYMHSGVNPNRDTSQDDSDLLNAFAGGAAGGVGPSVAGSAANAMYAGAGRTGEVVAEKAGEVVDMSVEGAKVAAKAGKQAYEDTGLKGVVDLGVEKGKGLWERAVKAGGAATDYLRDGSGKIDYAQAAEKAKADYDRYRLSSEEMNILTAEPPADMAGPELQDWMKERDLTRGDYTFSRMEQLFNDGVDEAGPMLAGMESDDLQTRLAAMDSATDFLLERNAAAKVKRKTAIFRAAVSGFTQRGAEKITRGAIATGKGAAAVASDVAEGVRQGVGGKRNNQGAGFTTLDYDTWKAMRDENTPPLAEDSQRAHAIQRAVEGRSRLKDLRGETKRPVDKAAAEASYRRATLFGEMMAAEAQTVMKAKGHLVQTEGDVTDYTNFTRSLAFEVEDMAQDWTGQKAVRPTGADRAVASKNIARLDALAQDIDGVLGDAAPGVISRMAESSDAATKPFMQELGDRLTTWKASKVDREKVEQSQRDRMVALLPREQQTELMQDDGAGSKQLLETLVEVTRGRVSREKREALNKALGAKNVNEMLTILGETAKEQLSPGEVVDDRGTPDVADTNTGMNDDGEVGDFEQRQSERKVVRNSAPRMFAFVGEKAQSLRTTDSENRRTATNPFEPTKRMTPAELADARQKAAEMQLLGEDTEPVVPVRRPRLTRKDEEGTAALTNKVAQLEKTLGVDRTPENFFRLAKKEVKGSQLEALSRLEQGVADNDPRAQVRLDDMMGRFFETGAGEYVVSTVSAKDVMDSLGMNKGQRLAIFRDYMYQDAAATKNAAVAGKLRNLARMAQKQLLDGAENFDSADKARAENADTPQRSGIANTARQVNRLTVAERQTLLTAFNRYFSDGHLVVAEQRSDRAAGQMSAGELIELARGGVRARESARGQANKSGNDAVANSMGSEMEGQLLNFKQRDGSNLLGTKDTTLPIRASALVAWVRNQRRETESTKVNGQKLGTEEAFLRDLMEGITTVVSMGNIEGMPYVLGPGGRRQQLTDRGVPDALQLPNRRGQSLNEAKNERLGEVRARPTADIYDKINRRRDKATEEVAAEQANEPDWFTGDPWEVPGETPKSKAQNAAAELQDTQQRSKDVTQSLGSESANFSAKANEERAAKVVAYTGKQTEVIEGGKLSRVDRTIDPAATLANIQRRLDAADGTVKVKTAGMKSDKFDRDFSAGKHYAFPLAQALSVKNVQEMLNSGAFDAAQSDQLVAAQAKAAGIIATAAAGPRLRLAQMMAKGQAEVGNYRDAEQFLKRLATAAPEVAAAELPKPLSAPAGAASTTVTDHQSSGYRERTKYNADSAGLTVAVAANYATAGERLTKSVAGEKYLAIPLSVPPKTGGVRLAKAMRQLDTTTLNVAGNGIYTLAPDGHTQASVNQHMYELISAAHALRPITKIVSGGQTGVDLAGAVAAERLGIPAVVTLPRGFVQRDVNGVDSRHTADDIKAQITAGASAQSLPTGTARKLNAQGAGGAVASSRELMRLMGFQAAPAQFADVAAKLLTAPSADLAAFTKQSSEALSHLLMEGASGKAIRAALGQDAWLPQRVKIAARLMKDGMPRPDALVASYREITRAALAEELTAMNEAEKSFVSKVRQMVKGLVSRFREATGKAEFADLVRNNLNALVAKAKGPIDLKANYKKVSFQEAVDGDPQAARVLAHMSKYGRASITGSIVLANSGTIYRDAANMLHDLDFVVKGTKQAAENHLRSAFPGAVQVYDFGTALAKTDSYIVPPKGATVQNITRSGQRVTGFEIVQNGEVIGRTWNDANGEHKTGVTGTMVDFFTGNHQEPSSTIPFKTAEGGFTIKAMSAGSIFDAKLSMGRAKDLNDYLYYVPAQGRKLNAQGAGGTDIALRRLLADAAAALDTNKRAREIMSSLSPADLNTLQNDITSMPTGQDRNILPRRMQEDFREWVRDYYGSESEEMMSPERQAETQTEYLEEILGTPEGRDAVDVMMAGAILGKGSSQFNKQSSAQSTNDATDPNGLGKTWKSKLGSASYKEIADAKAYVAKVLGPQIKAKFEEITGYSGEWIDAENTILVSSLTNAGVMNVARHEAMHAFFSKFIKANPKAVDVLSNLTDDPRLLKRLETLLANEPEALKQLADGEERLAYIYQFAMAGQLRLPYTPGTTLLHKIRKFLRRVFQMVSDQERAVDLLYSFEHGDFSTPSAGARALAKTINQGTWARQGSKAMDGVAQRVAAAISPASNIMANSQSPTARLLGRQFFANPGEEKAGHGEPGYLNERNAKMRSYGNLFRSAVDKLDQHQMDALTEAMQNETATDTINDPDVADAKERLHALFERFHRYLTEEKGLPIGKIEENYFPVVYDGDKVRDGGLAKLLAGKYAKNIDALANAITQKKLENAKAEGKDTKVTAVTSAEVVEAIINNISRDNPLDDNNLNPMRQDGVLAPWFASGKERVLDFLTPEDRALFQEKDLIKTVSRYVRQGVRTAEYASRFGVNGKLLDEKLKRVKLELEDASQKMLASGELKNEKARANWARRQYRDVANAVGAMEGSLGNDVGETLRKINSASIVYQNIRLLPLALFSSFVDPLGIVARGGEMHEAFTAFVNGMKAVARQWGDLIRDVPPGREKGHWEQLAEHAGVIDAATFSHLLADEYGSMYLDGRARKINELMFKANGMEAWNRSMRVSATQSAVKFIQKHMNGEFGSNEHSARWMAELGLNKDNTAFDEDGKLITDKRVLTALNPDMDMQEAEQIIATTHTALVRYVEGAILSPNAAQRPAWSSDPHYSMFAHLKQFAYSFHETLIKRAANEAKHGNYMPLGVFAWYIPTMIAADLAKGLMVGGGQLPGYMQSYDLGDWVVHGAERGGVLGKYQLGIDAVQHPFGTLGPMAEQITDVYTEPFEKFIVEALPAHAVYRNALV